TRRMRLHGADGTPRRLELAWQNALGRARKSPRHVRYGGAQARTSVRGAGAMVPQPAVGIESVQRQQLPGIASEQVDGVEDVCEHCLADEVVEREPGERQLRAHVSPAHLGVHPRRELIIDVVEPVEIWTGTETAAARLDSEQVAEHSDDEVRVQQAPTMTQSQ